MRQQSFSPAPKGFRASASPDAPKGFTVQALALFGIALAGFLFAYLALRAIEREQAFRDAIWAERQAACTNQPETPFCQSYLEWLAKQPAPKGFVQPKD